MGVIEATDHLFLLDTPYLYGENMRIKSRKKMKRGRRKKPIKKGVAKMEKDTRLLQISRFPLDLDDDLKIMAIRRRIRPTEYIVSVLRLHVEQEKKKYRRERRGG